MVERTDMSDSKDVIFEFASIRADPNSVLFFQSQNELVGICGRDLQGTDGICGIFCKESQGKIPDSVSEIFCL